MSTTVSTRGSEIIPASRLVPAVISGTTAFVECPSWCTVDHAEDPDACFEDLSHASDCVDLESTVIGRADGLQMFARLGLDPVSTKAYRRVPFLVLDGGGEADDLTLDAADEFADNLEAFAAQVRAMARTARAR